jgi:hypothetical protein
MDKGESGDCAEDPESQRATPSGTTTSTVTGEDTGEEVWNDEIRDSSSAFARSSCSCFRSLAATSDKRIVIPMSFSSSDGLLV